MKIKHVNVIIESIVILKLQQQKFNNKLYNTWKILSCVVKFVVDVRYIAVTGELHREMLKGIWTVATIQNEYNAGERNL